MTTPSLPQELFDLFKPYVPYGIALLCLWALKAIAGESLPAMVSGGWQEIKEFLTAKVSAKAANALAIVLLALLIAYIFGGPMRDLILPASTGHDDYVMAGVYSFNLVLFGVVALFSIKLSSYEDS